VNDAKLDICLSDIVQFSATAEGTNQSGRQHKYGVFAIAVSGDL